MYIIKYKTFELPPFFYAYYEIYNFIFFKKIKNYFWYSIFVKVYTFIHKLI